MPRTMNCSVKFTVHILNHMTIHLIQSKLFSNKNLSLGCIAVHCGF